MRLNMLGALLAGLGAGLGPAAPAAAGVACSVSVPAMDFGVYDTMQAVSLAGQGVNVNCSGRGRVAPVVSLSAGSGSYAARTMNAGVESLQYNLYADLAHTQVVGDGSAGTVRLGPTSLRLFNSSASVVFWIYGELPGGQNAAPGVYTSAPITVSVSY